MSKDAIVITQSIHVLYPSENRNTPLLHACGFPFPKWPLQRPACHLSCFSRRDGSNFRVASSRLAGLLTRICRIANILFTAACPIRPDGSPWLTLPSLHTRFHRELGVAEGGSACGPYMHARTGRMTTVVDTSRSHSAI